MNSAQERPKRAFWLMSQSVPACEIAARIGYDTVIVDAEHGVFEPLGLNQIVGLCRALGLNVICRPGMGTRAAVQQALDAGAHGVLLPQLEDTADAGRAAALTRYPPLGSRGYGGGRPSGYGYGQPATTSGTADDAPECWTMIETPRALEEVARIAALPTVDGLFIGPADLSLTRGRGRYAGRPEDFDDFARIATAAQAAGKRWAMPATTAEARHFATLHGAAFIAVSDDWSALGAGFATHLAAD